MSRIDHFKYLNTLLEPQAVLPLQTIGVNNQLIDYKILWSAWNISMNGQRGRYDKRAPTPPLTLKNVTLNGLHPDSHILVSDPSLPVYVNPEEEYYARMAAIENTLTTRFRSINVGETDFFTLFGPHGAIITSISNFDTPYLVLVAGDGKWINAWHEMGDLNTFVNRVGPVLESYAGNGVFRFGKQVLWPLSKYHLSAIRIGPADPENPSFSVGGAVTWVNVPLSWCKIPDPKVYLFRDDFLGTGLDTSKWNIYDTVIGVTEIDPLYQWLRLQKLTGGWGTQGITGKAIFNRNEERTIEFDIALDNNTTAMVGWMDNNGINYNNFVHGILFESAKSLQRISIFENGTNLGSLALGQLQAARIYHFKIVLRGKGATYLVQGPNFARLGSSEFTNITPTLSQSLESILRVGAFVSTGNCYISDIKVY
jgi:hypothetical protein